MKSPTNDLPYYWELKLRFTAMNFAYEELFKRLK